MNHCADWYRVVTVILKLQQLFEKVICLSQSNKKNHELQPQQAKPRPGTAVEKEPLEVGGSFAQTCPLYLSVVIHWLTELQPEGKQGSQSSLRFLLTGCKSLDFLMKPTVAEHVFLAEMPQRCCPCPYTLWPFSGCWCRKYAAAITLENKPQKNPTTTQNSERISCADQRKQTTQNWVQKVHF